MNCIICSNPGSLSFSTNDSKTYWSCNFCEGKYLDASHYINEDEEKERYLEHNNQIDDMAYRSFLGKLALPLQAKLSSGDTGLDFGCGHGPASSRHASSRGFSNVISMIHFFSRIKKYLHKNMTLLHAQKQQSIFITLFRNLMLLIMSCSAWRLAWES